MYLESFELPIESEESLIQHRIGENGGYIDNIYPCGIFGEKEFSEILFRKITIFYGGNGSGKSTILNLIAQRLELNRIAPFNSGELFDAYTARCKYTLGYDDEGFPYRIPNGSRIITSDDIFDYMLAARTNNTDMREAIETGKETYSELKWGKTLPFRGLEDYESLHLQLQARSKSLTRRQFIRKNIGQETRLQSNGETALRYFETKLKNDTLYCLDEPENSMSPQMQLSLVSMLEEMARYCGCQFILATHSPFLLALEGARIYDLDSSPVKIREWWQLENVRTYYAFFKKHDALFQQKPASK